MKAIICLIVILGATMARPINAAPAINFDDVMNIIKGTLASLNKANDVDNLNTCVNKIPDLVTDIEDVIAKFKALDWKDTTAIFKCGSKFFGTLKAMFDSLEPCFKVPTDITNVAAKIANISLDKLLSRILLQAFDMFTMLTEAIHYLQSKDYTNFGSNVGQILFIFLLQTDTVTDVNSFIEFIHGFLEGLNVKGDIKKVLECVNSGSNVIDKILAAFEYLKNLDIEHIGDIIKGVSMLVDAVKEIVAILTPCANSVEDLEKILETLSNLDVQRLIWKVIQNAGEFIADVQAVIAAFNKAEFRSAGTHTGSLLYKLLLTTIEPSDVVEFLKGFLEGLNEKGNVSELVKCMKGIEPSITKIIQAVQLIAKMTFQDIVQGITLLVSAVTDIITALKPCADGFEQIKKLLEAIANIDITKLVTKIMMNAGAFIKELTECIANFKAAKYNATGKNIGTIMYMLFLQE